MANKFSIIDYQQATATDVIICAPLTSPLIMPDNKIGRCSQCRGKLQHRPDVPKGPKLLCGNCAAGALAEEAAKGTLDLQMTQRSIDEAISFLIRGGQRGH